jgi:hypothetical protein
MAAKSHKELEGASGNTLRVNEGVGQEGGGWTFLGGVQQGRAHVHKQSKTKQGGQCDCMGWMRDRVAEDDVRQRAGARWVLWA